MHGLSPSDNGHVGGINSAISIQIPELNIAGLNGIPRRATGSNALFKNIYSRSRIIKIGVLVIPIPDVADHHPHRLAHFRQVKRLPKLG